MKRTLTPLLLLLLAAPLAAQEGTPDYSRDTLLRLFADGEERPERESRVDWSIGAVEFRAAGGRWRIGYLPFFVPWPGTFLDTTGVGLPDPFLLTGTEIASTPRSFRDRRAMSSEMRRIDRITKRANVKVEP